MGKALSLFASCCGCGDDGRPSKRRGKQKSSGRRSNKDGEEFVVSELEFEPYIQVKSPAQDATPNPFSSPNASPNASPRRNRDGADHDADPEAEDDPPAQDDVDDVAEPLAKQELPPVAPLPVAMAASPGRSEPAMSPAVMVHHDDADDAASPGSPDSWGQSIELFGQDPKKQSRAA